MNVQTAFGIILKQKRNKMKISQEELAYRCKLDRTFISMLERGKRRPTLNTFFTICLELNEKPHLITLEIEELLDLNQ